MFPLECQVAPLGKTGKNMNYTEEESPILSPPFNPPWG
jgi:hypothetical protein